MTNGSKTNINFDLVCEFFEHNNVTTIIYASATGGEMCYTEVKEPVSHILKHI